MLSRREQDGSKTRSGSRLGVPPWILLGAVLILAPIFIFWAAENIRRQKEMTTLLLLEKGAALIRSFEAGARTGMMGMMGMRGTAFKLQRLLVETAQLPDIVYLVVTDDRGGILAHSDPERIGGTYEPAAGLTEIPERGRPAWRRVTGPDGRPVFEVFRRFSPSPELDGFRRHGMMHGPEGRGMVPGRRFDPASDPGLIFVGLDLGAFEEARKEEARHTVMMAVILLLIGFAGLYSVFLVHAYRSARTSLGRIRAFSDHVVQNLPIGLVALDMEGRVASFNRTAESVLGRSGDRALGSKAADVLPPELSSLLDAAPEETHVIERELDCTTVDGRTVPLSASVSTLKSPGGESAGRLLLFRDLTEVRTLELEVERSRRLAAVGRLAGGVAHEIRNPLSSIKGFATYFKERYRHVEEDRRTADIMIQEVDRLNRVIGQLLDFARPMAVDKKPVRPDVVVRRALKLIEVQAEAGGIRLESRLPEAGTVDMDADRMGQVLLNLFLNAVEAMPGGGTLEVTAEIDEANRVARFTVRDTGKGITKDDLAHVFDPYFTTKSSGTGLGLAVVHKIVESHGGELRVESAKGEGTTVTIELPWTRGRHSHPDAGRSDEEEQR
ncbi:MAG: PAS domain-containing protein [Deltaproteobacteria bacterium]|nr:PAS domain-containing protein [Deltaproteobacteria bacterium]